MKRRLLAARIQKLESRNLLAADLIFPVEGAVNAGLIRDLDADGRDELVIVSANGVDVYDQDGVKFPNAPDHVRGLEWHLVEADGYAFGLRFTNEQFRSEYVGYTIDDSGFVRAVETIPGDGRQVTHLPQGFDLNGDQLTDDVTVTETTVEITYGTPIVLPDPVPAPMVTNAPRLESVGWVLNSSYARALSDVTGDGLQDIVIIGVDSNLRPSIELIASESAFGNSRASSLPAPGIFTSTRSGHLDVIPESSVDGFFRFTAEDNPSIGYVGRFVDGQLQQFSLDDPKVAELIFSDRPNGIFDLNGDGTADQWTYGGDLEVLLMPPLQPLDVTLEAEVIFTTRGGTTVTEAVSIGDYNGDGGDDVLIELSAYHDIYSYGDASFLKRPSFVVLSQSGRLNVFPYSQLPFDSGAYISSVQRVSDGSLLVDATPFDSPSQPTVLITPDAVEVVSDPLPITENADPTTFDFNGDGLADSIVFTNRLVGVALAQPESPESIIGDMDQDGDVDFADFLSFSSNFGRMGELSITEGDFDDDGRVGFSDFLLLAQNFGTEFRDELAGQSK